MLYSNWQHVPHARTHVTGLYTLDCITVLYTLNCILNCITGHALLWSTVWSCMTATSWLRTSIMFSVWCMYSVFSMQFSSVIQFSIQCSYSYTVQLYNECVRGTMWCQLLYTVNWCQDASYCTTVPLLYNEIGKGNPISCTVEVQLYSSAGPDISYTVYSNWHHIVDACRPIQSVQFSRYERSIDGNFYTVVSVFSALCSILQYWA